MIRSSYRSRAPAALCLIVLLLSFALFVPVAGARQGAAAPEAALPPIPPPPIHEFSSAERIPPENPDTIFARPGGDDASPAGAADSIDSASPEPPDAAASSGAARHGQGHAGQSAKSRDDAGPGQGPLALPDPYLDPSWPDIRPPLRAERRQRRLEADEAEREQAASGKPADAEEAAVPLTGEDLYMKEEHEDTWDEDFKDSKGEPTDIWDPNYEDPAEW